MSKYIGNDPYSDVGVLMGQPDGVATLDANGEVVQLPAGASAAAKYAVLRKDGSWTLPTMDCFCVFSVGTSYSVAQNSWTAITWGNADYDPLNLYDSANPTRVSVPDTGLYAVNLYATFDTAFGAEVMVRMKLNGAVHSNMFDVQCPGSYSDSNPTVAATRFLSLVAGDYLEFDIVHSSGASQTLSAKTSVALVKVG